MRGVFAAQKSRYRTYTNLPPAGASPPDTRGGDTGLSFQFAYYAAGVYSFNVEIGVLPSTTRPRASNRNTSTTFASPCSTSLTVALICRCAAKDRPSATPRPPSPLLKPGGIEHWKPEITGPCDYCRADEPQPGGVRHERIPNMPHPGRVHAASVEGCQTRDPGSVPAVPLDCRPSHAPSPISGWRLPNHSRHLRLPNHCSARA